MSFCSYEEAWGSPYTNDESQQKNDHVEKQPELPNDFEEFTGGMVETAPLRGSLLGGAIPEEQWNTNTPQVCEKDDISSFEARFDKKLDKLVATIEKYTTNFKQNVGGSAAETSWTDLLLFVALGILAIVVLDLFFKFGKMIVTTKLEAKYSAMQQPIPQQPPLYGGRHQFNNPLQHGYGRTPNYPSFRTPHQYTN